MAHMGVGPGAAHIFDEVDKSDFKADFGSEFPVGSAFASHDGQPSAPPSSCPAFVSCPCRRVT